MEKNIHDDRLDDYVKGSFEDYAENPATDMWERIEGQLPEEPKPVWYAWRRFGWPMAAGLVILLLIARLVFVEGYYEEKLQKISAQQDQAGQNGMQIPTLKPSLPINDAYEKSTAGTVMVEPDNTSTTVQKTDTKTKAPAQKQQQASTTTTKIAKPGESKVEAIDKQALQETALPKTLNNNASQEFPGIKTADLSLLSAVQQAENQRPSVPALPRDSMADIAIKIEEHPDFQILAQKSPMLSISNLTTPNSVAITTKKYKEDSGWYMGLFGTPHFTLEKTKQTVRPGPRRRFTSQQERPQVSSDISLRVGKKINSRFAIESGLGYQHLNRTATHLARFEYREGQSIQNPGGMETRSFDYDLNTYSGSASVSLWMEVSGSDAPAAMERVGALITSKESLQILQVPVLGVARLGQGRVKAVLKAGVLGSYLMKNSFEITAYRLENHKLRIRNQDGYSVQFNRPQHFIWGYQLSAGAEFRLTKNLSLSAAPTLSGDFQRKDPQQGRLPGQTAVGMNLGVIWWF